MDYFGVLRKEQKDVVPKIEAEVFSAGTSSRLRLPRVKESPLGDRTQAHDVRQSWQVWLP